MFMLRDVIDIDATPQQVWSVVTDFAAYREWNPYIKRFETTGEEGSELLLELIQPNWKRSMLLRQVLLANRENEELCWRGRVGPRGLFATRHVLRVGARGPSASRFYQEETFSGVFSPLLPGAARRATRATFALMNKALKYRVEGLLRAGRL